MMTQIISKLPEEYENMVEILQKKLHYEYNPLTMERICYNLLLQYDQMNEQSIPKTPTEYEKFLYLESHHKGS